MFYEERMARKHKTAGHRRWAANNAPVAGVHVGDIMSREKRSALMGRIRGIDTGPERLVCAELRRLKLRFIRHASDVPGKPDVVFRGIRCAIFIDGDFWHGWRFPLWRHKLSPIWQQKIAANRNRDMRTFRRLRRIGWKVIRLWEHEIERDMQKCIGRILRVRDQLVNERAILQL